MRASVSIAMRVLKGLKTHRHSPEPLLACIWTPLPTCSTANAGIRSSPCWLHLPAHFCSTSAPRAGQQQGPSSPGRGVTSVEQDSELQPPSQQTPRYSPLHYNVAEFCEKIVPNDDERKFKQQIIET